MIKRVKARDFDTSKAREIFTELLDGDKSVAQIVAEKGIRKVDESELVALCRELLAANPKIVADVKAGKGTLGALLVDPSVYEDLKMVLGNVERNKALRALVRYSIRRDGSQPSVEVRDPAPSAVGSKKPVAAEAVSADVGASTGQPTP